MGIPGKEEVENRAILAYPGIGTFRVGGVGAVRTGVAEGCGGAVRSAPWTCTDFILAL